MQSSRVSRKLCVCWKVLSFEKSKNITLKNFLKLLVSALLLLNNRGVSEDKKLSCEDISTKSEKFNHNSLLSNIQFSSSPPVWFSGNYLFQWTTKHYKKLCFIQALLSTDIICFIYIIFSFENKFILQFLEIICYYFVCWF